MESAINVTIILRYITNRLNIATQSSTNVELAKNGQHLDVNVCQDINQFLLWESVFSAMETRSGTHKIDVVNVQQDNHGISSLKDALIFQETVELMRYWLTTYVSAGQVSIELEVNANNVLQTANITPLMVFVNVLMGILIPMEPV